MVYDPTEHRTNSHAAPREDATPEPFRILLPLGSRYEAQIMLPVAKALARDRMGEIVILRVIEVSEGQSLTEATASVSRARQETDEFLRDWPDELEGVRVIVRAGFKVWDEIWETVAQERSSMLLAFWSGGQQDAKPLSPHAALAEQVDTRLRAPPCDILAIRLGADLAAPGGWQAIKRVLLPVRGGPNSGLALRVAYALAEAADARITMLHATDAAAYESQARLLAVFGPALRNLRRLTRSITAVGDVSQAVIAEAGNHDLIVMGAPSQHVSADGWNGPPVERIAAGTQTTLVIAKQRMVPELHPASVAPLNGAPALTALSPRRDRPLGLVVDKWFAENTFRSAEFVALDRLLKLKEEQGLSISLGLPALNEEATVGAVIRTVKAALMDQAPLLDEIVLIDSGSVDYTREIAADLGIPVFIHQEVLPQYGAYRGKGEALWKSLYVLSGDIVAWIDTDITNIHPRFVYGIIGPLLRDARIQYVKGFYRRPLREGEKLMAGGGGRVTELTARPLLNLFYPELSGLIQPLSGEYAGRRKMLECVPFFTGYGVETGLLIDVLEASGLGGIAQVDLLERIHHSQPLPSLSKMSFAIIQVVTSRLETRNQVRLLEETDKTMNLVRYEPGRYYLETEEIIEYQRPPIISVPEYRARHHPADATVDD